jgi:hypothetical protein
MGNPQVLRAISKDSRVGNLLNFADHTVCHFYSISHKGYVNECTRLGANKTLSIEAETGISFNFHVSFFCFSTLQKM